MLGEADSRSLKKYSAYREEIPSPVCCQYAFANGHALAGKRMAYNRLQAGIVSLPPVFDIDNSAILILQHGSLVHCSRWYKETKSRHLSAVLLDGIRRHFSVEVPNLVRQMSMS